MSRTRRALSFGLAGTVGFLVDLAIVLALTGALGPVGARAVSFPAAIVATWLINRSLTFPDRDRALKLHVEFGRYLGAMLVGALINWAVYLLVVALLPDTGLRPLIAVAAGSLSGMAANLTLADRFVFRPGRNG